MATDQTDHMLLSRDVSSQVRSFRLKLSAVRILVVFVAGTTTQIQSMATAATTFWKAGMEMFGSMAKLARISSKVVEGGSGADRLNGGFGVGTASYLTATGGVGADLANAKPNTSDASGDIYTSIENLAGSTLNDALFVDNGKNSIWGDSGRDKLTGRNGNSQ